MTTPTILDNSATSSAAAAPIDLMTDDISFNEIIALFSAHTSKITSDAVPASMDTQASSTANIQKRSELLSQLRKLESATMLKGNAVREIAIKTMKRLVVQRYTSNDAVKKYQRKLLNVITEKLDGNVKSSLEDIRRVEKIILDQLLRLQQITDLSFDDNHHIDDDIDAIVVPEVSETTETFIAKSQLAEITSCIDDLKKNISLLKNVSVSPAQVAARESSKRSIATQLIELAGDIYPQIRSQVTVPSTSSSSSKTSKATTLVDRIKNASSSSDAPIGGSVWNIPTAGTAIVPQLDIPSRGRRDTFATAANRSRSVGPVSVPRSITGRGVTGVPTFHVLTTTRDLMRRLIKDFGHLDRQLNKVSGASFLVHVRIAPERDTATVSSCSMDIVISSQQYHSGMPETTKVSVYRFTIKESTSGAISYALHKGVNYTVTKVIQLDKRTNKDIVVDDAECTEWDAKPIWSSSNLPDAYKDACIAALSRSTGVPVLEVRRMEKKRALAESNATSQEMGFQSSTDTVDAYYTLAYIVWKLLYTILFSNDDDATINSNITEFYRENLSEVLSNNAATARPPTTTLADIPIINKAAEKASQKIAKKNVRHASRSQAPVSPPVAGIPTSTNSFDAVKSLMNHEDDDETDAVQDTAEVKSSSTFSKTVSSPSQKTVPSSPSQIEKIASWADCDDDAGAPDASEFPPLTPTVSAGASN